MPLTAERLERILDEGESGTVEFKSLCPPDAELAKYIAAFANSDGGVLLIGVGPLGQVLGLGEDEGTRTISRLEKLSRTMLTEPVEIGWVERRGTRIVAAIIRPEPPERGPVLTARGEWIVRNGADYEIKASIPEAFWARRGSSVAQAPNPAREAEAKAAPKSNRPVEAFVAMSFRSEEEPALEDYFAAMQRASKATGLPIKLKRVDMQAGDYEISQQIMTEIDVCEIFIADFTLSSPNVYFEMGYARGRKGLEIIQTARKSTELGFDIRNWRTIFYKNATELEAKLPAELARAYQNILARFASTAQG